VLRIVKGADPRWWLVVGTIVGICVESKYTVIFLATGVVFGLLVLPQRRVLFTAWFAGGILVAALIALPNFLWQAAHGFPMWTLLRAAAQYKDVSLTPLQFLVTQLLITYPLLAPVWLIGLATLLRRADVRFLGIAYLALIAQMIVLHAKHYYDGDVYPIPIAAGAVTIEAWTTRVTLWRPVLTLYALIAGLAGTHDVRVRPHAANYTGARSESRGHRTHADRQLTSRLGRHARLAGTGANRRTRLRLAAPSRARSNRNPCKQLR
jgi:Dolichyl-phosphate-mannose-protein mannosyltransferase